MNDHIAVRPFSSLNSESRDDIFSGKEFSNKIKVVTERWVLTFFCDIVDIESGRNWVSEDVLSGELADFEGDDPGQFGKNQTLTNLVGSPEEIIAVLGDKIVLQGELSVLRILVEWVSPSVSDSNSDKVEVVLLEDGSNGGDIVSSVALTGDENFSVLELGELGQESLNEDHEVGSNFVFILRHLREWGI